jgi:tyrosine-protein kinase Etk/Wzc
MQQYELARIQEQKESSTFTLIDAAYIPQKPVRPRKILYAVAGAILGMLLSLGLVFFRERSKSPSAEQMNK